MPPYQFSATCIECQIPIFSVADTKIRRGFEMQRPKKPITSGVPNTTWKLLSSALPEWDLIASALPGFDEKPTVHIEDYFEPNPIPDLRSDSSTENTIKATPLKPTRTVGKREMNFLKDNEILVDPRNAKSNIAQPRLFGEQLKKALDTPTSIPNSSTAPKRGV